jgi:serine/threonine protein kinase
VTQTYLTETPPQVELVHNSKGIRRFYINFATPQEAYHAMCVMGQLMGSGHISRTYFYPEQFACWKLEDFKAMVTKAGLHLVQHIKELILQSPGGYISADVVVSEARLLTGLPAYRSQGWWWHTFLYAGSSCTCEEFCNRHYRTLRYVRDASGPRVEIAEVVDVGSRVRVKRDIPAEMWGDVFQWSVGYVREVVGTTVTVNFPEQSDWIGMVDQLFLADSDYPNLRGEGFDNGDRFDLTAFVQSANFHANRDAMASQRNHFIFTGTVEGRRPHSAEYGFLHARQMLTPLNPFFAVRIVSVSTDISVGLSGKSFFAGNMMGWRLGSVGLYARDGTVCFVDCGERVAVPLPFEDREGGAEGFRPGDIIGCGVTFDGSQPPVPQTVYFTRDQNVVARYPLLDGELEMLYPVVTGASPAEIEFTNTAPPAVPMACSVTARTYIAKFRRNSRTHKPVRMIRPLDPGHSICIFDGWTDSNTVPNENMLLIDTRKEFSNAHHALDYVFKYAVDGAKIQIHVGCAQIIRQVTHITRACTIEGDNTNMGNGKPVILYAGRCVFSVRANTRLINLNLTCLGAEQGMQAADVVESTVTLHEGDLAIESCNISNMVGSGVSSQDADATEPGSLLVRACRIGPCGVSGIALASGNARMEGVVVERVQHNGVICKAASKLSMENCEIRACGRGLALFHPRLVEAKNCKFIDCRSQAVLHEAMRPESGETQVIMTGCSFSGHVVKSDGTLGNINLLSCSDARILSVNEGQIHIDEAAVGQTLAPVNGADNSAQAASSEVQHNRAAATYIQEKDEQALPSAAVLARNKYLWDELTRSWAAPTLAVLFKATFQGRVERAWSPDYVEYVMHVAAANGMRFHYTEQQLLGLRQIRMWDVSLLRKLLTLPPFRPAQGLEAALNTVASCRNGYSHMTIMCNDDFNRHFPAAYESLRLILRTVLATYENDCGAGEQLASLEEWHRHETEMLQVLESDQVSPLVWQDAVDSYGHIDLGRMRPGRYIVMLENEQKYEVRTPGLHGVESCAFEAYTLPDRRKVVLKMCKSSEVHEAVNEVQVLRKLADVRHDNIIGYIDSFSHSRSFVLVTEYVQGQSLDEFLECLHGHQGTARNLVPWVEAKKLMLQLADGMAVIHERKIVHRNLKPSNLKIIYRMGEYKVKIVDFGVSKHVRQQQQTNTTSIQRIKKACTNLYMSPELIALDMKEVSPASDVWSMGVILYEMLTKTKPFWPKDGPKRSELSPDEDNQIGQNVKTGFTPYHAEIVRKSLNEYHPQPDSSKIIEVLEKCMNPRISHRYQNAAEFHADLTSALLVPAVTDEQSQQALMVTDEQSQQQALPVRNVQALENYHHREQVWQLVCTCSCLLLFVLPPSFS